MKGEWRTAACAAGLGLFLSAFAMAGTKPNTSAASEALVKRALASCDIMANGVPAARLYAHFRINYAPGKSAEGELLRIWTPTGWWHEELAMSGYRSTEVSDGKQEWRAGTLRYIPYPIFLIRRALTLPAALDAAEHAQLGPLLPTSDGAVDCVDTEGHGPRFSYCFDTQDGNLLRMFDGEWNVTFQYADYQPLGTKRFPRRLEVLLPSGRQLAEIHIDQLVPEKHPDLRIFLPVKGSEEEPVKGQCEVIERPKLKKLVKPQYPREAEAAGITGVVQLYAEIGKDGIPRGLWPINSVPPVLSRAAIEAVRRWHYRPQTCKATGATMAARVKVTVLFVTR
jgi:TonB family protein